MSEVLWTPHFQPGLAGGFARPYIRGIAVRWLPGLTIINASNPIVLREHTYGGYTKWLKVYDWAWELSHKSFNLSSLLEYYYVIPPASSDHVSNGDVNVRVEWFDVNNSYWWVSEDTGAPGDAAWYFFEFPNV
jgi:hypothetical protein